MPTTAGSRALVRNFAERDAPVVAALRAAGAVILGKTNLSEWANFRSAEAVSGWSAVGGLTRNPYVLDRTACGSSSGSAVAVAAGMAAASLGTETDGSITCPASMNGLVGLKPTHGLLPGEGIVPIAHSQDTAGPIGRGVADVARLLDVLVTATTATRAAPSAPASYTSALVATALEGKRIGVLRFNPGAQRLLADVYERALERLRSAGALLVEVERPDLRPIEAAERLVLLTEFKTDLDEYLSHTPRAVGVRNLAELIDFDLRSPEELTLFGQDVFLEAERTTGLDDPAYRQALAQSRRLAGAEGIERLLHEHGLDLLVAPTTTPAWRIDTVLGDRDAPTFATLAAVAGYPHLTVPMGEVRGLPVGLSFIGPARSERLLLGAGYAFEQRSPRLPPPRFIPSLDGGSR